MTVLGPPRQTNVMLNFQIPLGVGISVVSEALLNLGSVSEYHGHWYDKPTCRLIKYKCNYKAYCCALNNDLSSYHFAHSILSDKLTPFVSSIAAKS